MRLLREKAGTNRESFLWFLYIPTCFPCFLNLQSIPAGDEGVLNQCGKLKETQDLLTRSHYLAETKDGGSSLLA